MEKSAIIAQVLAETTLALSVSRTTNRTRTVLHADGAWGSLTLSTKLTETLPDTVFERTVDGSLVEVAPPAPLRVPTVLSAARVAAAKFRLLPDARFLFEALAPETPSDVDMVCFAPGRVWTTSLTSAHVVDLPASWKVDAAFAFPADVLRLVAAVGALDTLEVAREADGTLLINAKVTSGSLTGFIRTETSTPALSLEMLPSVHQSRVKLSQFENLAENENENENTSVVSFALSDSSALCIADSSSHPLVSVAVETLLEKIDALCADENCSSSILVGVTSYREPVLLRAAKRLVVLAPVVRA
jgi:hypothetical protein